MSGPDTLYYLRSILRQLQQVRDYMGRGPTLGGEILADNIDWLDCYIDSLSRQPAPVSEPNASTEQAKGEKQSETKQDGGGL